jgi:hypothetical protein
MLMVCKSVCKLAPRCLAHRVTTNIYFRQHELVDGEPELGKDCRLFWDIDEDTTPHKTTKR